MSRVQIADVRLADADAALSGHGLDTPGDGTRSAFFGFDVRGWAVGRRVAARVVVLRQAFAAVAEAPVDDERPDVADAYPGTAWSASSGFLLPVGALGLDLEFELELHVRLTDGAEARLAQIRGTRQPLQAGFEPAIAPLGLTALGRTGSTMVTRLLATHPQIAAYRPFEYEPRVVTYWLDVLQRLAAPASFRRQVTPNGPLEGEWWAGARPPFPRRITDDALQSWMGGDSVDELADFCLGRIEGFYTRVAGAFQRRDARYFVEKLGPRTGGPLRELCPPAREIFLVRDFRDIVASVFAFNAKRGYQGFGRNRAATDADYVHDWAGRAVSSFLHAWRTRAAGAHLVRYEDVLRDPRRALSRMLEYLELDDGAATLDTMLASLDAPESDVHRTTSPADSIGRWRRDLAPDVREACASALAPALGEFGYDG